MGQIIGAAAKCKRANFQSISSLGTPSAGEVILISTDNSMQSDGQGNFDSYLVGDGSTTAKMLTLKRDFSELSEAAKHLVRSDLGIQCPDPVTINAYDLPIKYYTSATYQSLNAVGNAGTTVVSHVVTSSTATYNVLIPVNNIAKIDAPVFKTSSAYGSCFADASLNVVENCKNTTEATGSIVTYDVPDGAAYYCFFSGTALLSSYPTNMPFVLYSNLYVETTAMNESVSAMEGAMYVTNTIAKTELISSYVWANNKLLPATSSVVGTNISNVTLASSSSTCYIFKVPISSSITSLDYLVFKTTSGYGSVITDSNGVILSVYSNSTSASGTASSITDIPSDAAYFYYNASGSLQSYSYYVSTATPVSSIVEGLMTAGETTGYSVVPRLLPYLSEYNTQVENSLCLCSIKFRQESNAMPFQEGYLFHKMVESSATGNKYYYGTTLENAVECAEVDYRPSKYVVAISPTDGTIIAAYLNGRYPLRVFSNGTNYSVAAVSSDGESASPMGWLYNSGVQFVNDGTTEYCIFAEYYGSVSNDKRLYIWKGTYPYTSASDWKTVTYKTTSYNSGSPTAGSITHFHMIRQDPWTNVIYTTTGDYSGQFMWLYSTDYGETWTELASDYNSDTIPSWVADGQPLRCINFIFTEDYVYFATDHGSNNTLCRISRDSDGVIDPTTREVLSDLPYGVAVNSLCYTENPNGLFLFTRIDSGFYSVYLSPVPILFWSFANEELYTLLELPKTEATWGGHRGKCYFNYTNAFEPRPAMGFADNTTCLFDLSGASDGVGTIFYELSWSN